MPAETQFTVMGCEAHVVVVGGDEPLALALARERLDDLDRRWSRFRPDSELSRLNQRSGFPVVVSPDTFMLVSRSVQAWHATGGGFDPTVLPALRAAGYDRDFALLGEGLERAVPAPFGPSPGCASIRLDGGANLVWLPAGVTIDSGGIGKGLAADLVAGELRVAGVDGALVNVGGDLRAVGTPPDGDHWAVSVEDPFDRGREQVRLALASGAVATSSRLRRTWRAGDRVQHHLIDPLTGEPARRGPAAATVVAAEAWWAEALATALCVSPWPVSLAGSAEASVLFTLDGGRTVATPELAAALP